VASASIRIQNGSFYLDAALYETYFRGLESLAVMRRDDRLLLVPLQRGSAGGSLAKVRNARGDRVIHAREFLRELGIGDFETHEVAVQWDAELAALAMVPPGVPGPARSASTGEATSAVGGHNVLPRG
jgi:hypothetical protein